MTLTTALTKCLNCRHPIISAGMGGPARWELAAAVSEAGGFGLLGMVREAPDLIAREIAEVRRRTAKPFGVNLIPFATDPKLLREELAVCLDARVPAMCFFWDVYPEIVAQAKKAGCLVLHQVGSLEDALLAESAGADVVILQGVEAGGHVRAHLPLNVLLSQVARKLRIPIVASGGIADGRGLVAALALGADGIQCGTAFLASTESFAHDYHKQRLIAAKAGETVHTDLFAINWPPNSPVRVLRNSVTDEAKTLGPSSRPVAARGHRRRRGPSAVQVRNRFAVAQHDRRFRADGTLCRRRRRAGVGGAAGSGNHRRDDAGSGAHDWRAPYRIEIDARELALHRRHDAFAGAPVADEIGAAEIIALQVVDAGLHQERRIFADLHELGAGLESDGLGEAHQAADEQLVVDVDREVAHERAVDLDHVDGQRLQVAERGEASAEIVDRNAAAQIAH